MTKHKILVVDDDAKVSTLLHIILEKVGGYEVREESHSSHALACAREFQPDLVLLDINMPEKDGNTVRTEMALVPDLASVPVLYINGILSPQESADASVVRGSDHFMSKPFYPRCLLKTVETMLASAS
jgi:DNA-binding response OmpR family regulator